MESDLQSLDPVTKAPPPRRILDATSLNAVVAKIASADSGSALARVDVQQMVDGAPPFDQKWLDATGQGGRCNLNFGDGKAKIKAEMSGYYDLTDSVPTLALVLTDYGKSDDPERAYYNAVLSEEFHRLLKDWKPFDSKFQLLVQRFVTHGVGFLYFKDDVDWRWECAGLDEFKLPRNTSLSEDEVDVATCFREVTIGKLWGWIRDVEDSDTRWNKKEIETAILKAADKQITSHSVQQWEKWQAILKNNDVFASASAQGVVHIAHCWVREFTGKVSHYITLAQGGNTDFLYKSEDRYDAVDQCFTYFPYEIGTNGYLHSIRGKGHEVYATVQVLNSMRCQLVDNAKLAGSLLLQPKAETDQEELAILFYAGAAYIPPNVDVKNGQLNNPSQGLLPVIRDMSMLMEHNAGETAAQAGQAGQGVEQREVQVKAQLAKDAVLPTASMNLFYQPWGRHLNEVWRRVANKNLLKSDPGAKEIFELRERVIARGVPVEAIYEAKRVIPVRAIGYGSPAMRQAALDDSMKYYGSLDPVGQNNLLRDWFAQKVTYGQVDRYVPRIEQNGRQPLDQEVAELQNVAMSTGVPVSVVPNDHHIIHMNAHMPSLEHDLDYLESGQGSPQLLASAQIKAQHISDHLKLTKPDVLNETAVSELNRRFNNNRQRVGAATEHAQREQAKAIADQMQGGGQQSSGPSAKAQEMIADSQVRRQIMTEEHDLKMRLETASANQRMATEDAKAARKINSTAARERYRGSRPVESAPGTVVQPVVQPVQPVTNQPSPAPAETLP
jgi:hypothetical protein